MTWSANMSTMTSTAFSAYGIMSGIMSAKYSSIISKMQTKASIAAAEMQQAARRYGIRLNKEANFEVLAMRRKGAEGLAKMNESTVRSRVKTAEYHKQIKVLTSQVLKARQRKTYPTPTAMG